MFFKRKASVIVSPEEQHKQQLYEDMRFSLTQYHSAVDEYNSYLMTDVDSASPFARMLAFKAEGFRAQYYALRVEYEKYYGDASQYQEKLRLFFMSRKENNLVCLVQKPICEYTQQLASEQVN